jgi:hypothetical protein
MRRGIYGKVGSDLKHVISQLGFPKDAYATQWQLQWCCIVGLGLTKSYVKDNTT